MSETLIPAEVPPARPSTEQVVRVWHPSLATHLWSVLAGVALLVAGLVTAATRELPWGGALGGAVVGALLLGRAWLLCRSATFTVTTLRVRRVEGLIGRNSWETGLKDVRNVTVQQSFSQRLFGIGTVEITSAGGPYVDVRFHGVRRPQEVSELIWKLKG